jgi:amino acid permease
MQSEQPPVQTPENGAVTKTATQARQGIKLGTMRWVLGISMALAIVGVAIAYFVA